MPENSSRLDRIEAAIENLHVNIESLHASVSELYATVLKHENRIQKHDDRIQALLAAAERDGENIRALARIAEIHERRISDLEGPEGPSNT